MLPFALLTMVTLPFMAFGTEMEMRMCVGEDEGDVTEEKENSPGSVVVETLTNIRTVASLAIEDTRAEEYEYALHHEEKNPLRTNLVKGAAFGLGQFVQMWGMGECPKMHFSQHRSSSSDMRISSHATHATVCCLGYFSPLSCSSPQLSYFGEVVGFCSIIRICMISVPF